MPNQLERSSLKISYRSFIKMRSTPIYPQAFSSEKLPNIKEKAYPPQILETRPKARSKNTSHEIFHRAIEGKDPASFENFTVKLMSSYNLFSKQQIYEQYDTEIGTSRLLGPGQNAGLIRLDEENIGICAQRRLPL